MRPICHDALGRALLATETDRDVYGIVRRANAEEGAKVIGVEAFMEELRAQRKNGYAECDDFGSRRERVLAIPLRAPFGIPAAIGIGVHAGRLPVERQDLLRLLDWVGQNIAAKAPCASWSCAEALSMRERTICNCVSFMRQLYLVARHVSLSS